MIDALRYAIADLAIALGFREDLRDPRPSKRWPITAERRRPRLRKVAEAREPANVSRRLDDEIEEAAAELDETLDRTVTKLANRLRDGGG